jgi:hypothetical protein
MHISITGLKPKGIFGHFRFWILAVPTFIQAKKARGNVFSEVKKIQGFQCTLTAWESKDHMLDFLRSGSHLNAMKAFHSIATGKIYGYESDVIPEWKDAFEILQSNGRTC